MVKGGEIALRFLYQMELKGWGNAHRELDNFLSGYADTDTLREIIMKFLEKKERIETLLKDNVPRFDQLDPIEKSILRLAIAEMMLGIPWPVVLNDSIELAKKYGSTTAYAFLNAVLDKIKCE